MTLHYEDDLVTLHHGDCLDVLGELPDASVDAVVTDPPYGLANTSADKVAETVLHWTNGDRDFLPGGRGFMGKEWDAFVPPVAVWDECLRVLKPGGHALAFAGSRTSDLMGLAMRLAGFDIRDNIAWLYGSGFPKSRDVTDSMQRYLEGVGPDGTARPIRDGVYDVTAYLRAARDKAGWTNKQIDALFGTNGMAGHWVSNASQPAVPSIRQWEELRQALGFGHEMDALVAELASTERPEDWGSGASEDETFLSTLRKNDTWERPGGWGTALKPAFEPVIVGRKPVRGTTSTNVATYGTGALNIDGCRVGDTERATTRSTGERVSGNTSMAGGNYAREEGPVVAGRWPTNVALDDTQAAALDRQAPSAGAGGQASGATRTGRHDSDSRAGAFLGTDTPAPFYGDSGGASRFFPTFRYEAKAPTFERPRDGETAHPTVKPLDLMRWLVRLVTPPGGVVLEPFAGSGTTAEACVIEGFRCIAVEREASYLPLIVGRLSKPIQPDLFGGAA